MKKNTIKSDQILKIVEASTFTVDTTFGKNTVVTMQLPNGFVLTESSACVDPDNYNLSVGVEICKKRLAERVWELEGYKLQDKIYQQSKPERNLEEFTIGELLEMNYNIQVDTFPIDERVKIILKGRA
ncbi:MAG: Gp49 family protein [Parabacteroides sp.]|nr:Gp49 family protein [Parabacteroides sp.]